MKKRISLLTALVMLCCFTAAFAATLAPQFTFSEDAFLTGDSTVQANFSAEEAFDENGLFTFTVLENDLYDTEAVKALQVGDTIVVYGEEETVTSIRLHDDGIIEVNGTDDEIGYEFHEFDISIPGKMCVGETDIPPATEMGTYTLPLAEQVEVRVWELTADGYPSQELTPSLLTPAEVRALFLSRSDDSSDDWLNTMGNHVLVRVVSGVVTEIEVDWGADD